MGNASSRGAMPPKRVKPTIDEGIKFTASKVKVLANSKGSYIQFTLTMLFGVDEAGCTWRNCLCGIGKNGPWAMPSQHKFKPVVWNKPFAERIIKAFDEAGTLKQIEGKVWCEDEDVQVEWGEK